MSYEYMTGMGTVDLPGACSESFENIRITNGARRVVTQADLVNQQEGEDITEGCVLMDPNYRHEGRLAALWCCPSQAGTQLPTTATPSTSAGLTPSGLRPSPFDEGGEAAAPAGEKQTWWTGDIEGMVSGFFSKLGIGERAAEEAEGAAREAAAAAAPGPTSIRDVAPTAQTPRVQVEDTTPWYVQYAPHMVIGGLGLGAVVTLVLVMRKRG
jgi:hypothetical protein